MRTAYPVKFIFIINRLGIHSVFLRSIKNVIAVVKNSYRRKHDVNTAFYSPKIYSNIAYTYFKCHNVASYLINNIKCISFTLDIPHITTIIRRSFVLTLMDGAAVNFQDCSSNPSCSSHITYWLFLRHQRRAQLQFVRHPTICINNSFAIMPQEIRNIQSISKFS